MQKFFLIILWPFLVYAQDGVVKKFYNNSIIESEITYLDGIREGEAKFFNPDGSLKEERFYINGRVEGLVKVYGDSNKVKELIILEYGKRNGPVSLFNDSGDYVTDMYYDNGRKIVVNEPVAEPEKVINSQEEILVEQKKEPVKEVKKKKNNNSVLPPSIDEETIYNDDPAYYLSVEVMPEPFGGIESIQRRVYYPAEAKRRKIEGVVKVLTFIDEYGVVEKAEVTEGLGYGCDEAAQTTVFYTKFKPGLIKGKPVKVQMVVPVEFKL
jgi:TonB family protein